MGAGAGIFSLPINCINSSMYSKSFMLGLDSVPVGKQISETHCCPPQSKPKISSLQPTLYPSDFLQNSASAKVIFMTCSLFKGSRVSNLSLSSVKESSFMSGSFSSEVSLVVTPALWKRQSRKSWCLRQEKILFCEKKISENPQSSTPFTCACSVTLYKGLVHVV